MRIYDVYEGERELYLILEYVEGGELFDFLVNRGKLAPLEALGYFKQIVYGLNYAHTFSIIHRDLKPENILIHSLNPPLVKIADWGMAAFAPPSLQLETSCGSPHYASPEIVNGFKYTGTATDIWSCGVILYALLTGRLPFDDKNVRNLLAKVKLGRYEMPAFVDPLAKDLLSRMLVVDVTKRITMAEILNHPWLETETPGITYVPAPPVAELAQPLPSALHIDRDLFESLCVIWGRHANPEMIKGDLLSPAGQGTLAKAFYFLLLKHRERTMEEHGILMDVTDVLNAAPGKVVTKQYSAPRARSKTLQLTGWDSHVATTAYHQSHPQHHSAQSYGQTAYNHHHLLRYSQYQPSNLRSTRPAPVAPAGPRPRTPSPVTSPQPVSHHGQNVRQPMSLPPVMDRPPSRPHPPSPAGPRPQRPRPTSSPPATLMRPNLNKAIGHPEFLALMRGTTGQEHLRPPAGSRRMLPAMERTGAMMSSSAPGSGATSGTGTGTGSMGPVCYNPQVRGATRFDVSSNGNENAGMESPVMPPTPQNSVFVPLPQSVQGSPHVQAPIQPQGQAQAQLQVGTVGSQGQGSPMIHAPVPLQATSGSSLVLPMITAPRVQDEALQRTMDYCASLVNGQAMSWNASVAKELEKERERLGSSCGPAGGKIAALGVPMGATGSGMVNEEFAKSRVALGEGGSQFQQVSGQMNSGPSAMRMQEDFGPQQQQQQQQHQQQQLHRHQQYVQSEQQGEKKMDVDTPKKGEDKENWDQQISVVAGTGANAPGQSESGGLGFGSSVPSG
ncbi:hypothetical protein NLI96_g13113 [Meripilus lineatus]|uniref:Protein kinase domain-containing protein n=1 Tax=Meripilus lineatus TaxID=2056292 RepID=A0AAD5UNL1_9APHY|nr:hypothetical protein NLI96_g13113 [Physisporinus lineatus]